MMRALSGAALMAVALGLPPSAGHAQDSGAIAAESCQRAVARQATNQYDAQRAQFLGAARVRQVSNAETGVTGRGQLDTYRGWVPFSYSCVYNIRTGRAENLSVRSAAPTSGQSASNNDAGKVVGALIGAAIAGAIINSMDKDGSRGQSRAQDGGWWSPADGVRCNSYQSACYQNGRFSARWTQRIYR